MGVCVIHTLVNRYLAYRHATPRHGGEGMKTGVKTLIHVDLIKLHSHCGGGGGGERDVAQRQSVRSWCGGSSDRSFMGWTHSSQCSTTGVTKAVVCVILSVGWCI